MTSEQAGIGPLSPVIGPDYFLLPRRSVNDAALKRSLVFFKLLANKTLDLKAENMILRMHLCPHGSAKEEQIYLCQHA